MVCKLKPKVASGLLSTPAFIFMAGDAYEAWSNGRIYAPSVLKEDKQSTAKAYCELSTIEALMWKFKGAKGNNVSKMNKSVVSSLHVVQAYENTDAPPPPDLPLPPPQRLIYMTCFPL
ncbi:hypothetical protein RND71_007427 [Anisodus tanguticus]|uniref:Uncharacterized protein n=1 Tax=Anisodus tanguticus TaxID=243964 RepID=A0AAE1SJ21_9SOLA|nr:hypothetical protein RND71_007427 [Anisodus tanguticus]